MQHELKGEFGDIQLRPLAYADIEAIRILRNRLSDWFIDRQQISQEGQEAWYQRYLKAPGDYMFIAEWKGWPNAVLGAAAIYNIDAQRQTGEFGRLMVQTDCTGRGVGFQITAAVCHIGFDQLGLSEITLEVLTDNLRARRVYEKVGFLPLDRVGVPLGGELTEMSLTRNEFYKIINRTGE